MLAREGLTLAQASWAVAWGFVRESGQEFSWRGEAQIRAMNEGLLAYLQSDAYRREADAARKAACFEMDRAAFDVRWSNEVSSLVGPSLEVSRSEE